MLELTAVYHLHNLCVEIENRHPGSDGNHRATQYVREQLEKFGWEVDAAWLDCLDWQHGGASLDAAGETIDLKPSPYSRAFDGEGLLVVADSFVKLQALDITGKILLCRGELTEVQLVPQNYPFYNLDEHLRVFSILNEGKPKAIISATDSDPGTAGGISPFPWIEDGSFNIPSCYCDVATGEILANYIGINVRLRIDSERIPSRLEQISATTGNRDGKRTIVCAHIDTKHGTPGALDNTTGVAILLLLAERLRTYSGKKRIELVFFNGEDYYDATGERYYMEKNAGTWGNVEIVVNIDAAGCKDVTTGLSYWNMPDEMQNAVHKRMKNFAGIEAMEPWPASDHMIFVPQGLPALVFTSSNFMYLTSEITHTMKDTIELVDAARLTEIGEFILAMIEAPN